MLSAFTVRVPFTHGTHDLTSILKPTSIGQTSVAYATSRAVAMPCLRNLGKALSLYDLPGRGHAAWPAILQAAAATQPRAALHDYVCEPATGTPAHPFQPVASSSTTGDTFVPKGAKLSGYGAHPLARYR